MRLLRMIVLFIVVLITVPVSPVPAFAQAGPSVTVDVGDTVRITWAATNGWAYSGWYTVDQASCGDQAGTNYPMSVSSNGSVNLQMGACRSGRIMTFYYQVTNSSGFATTASASVTVRANATCSLSLSPTAIIRGQNSALNYTSTNATGGTISPQPGAVGVSGVFSATPNVTTTYTGTFPSSGGGPVATCSATLAVTCAPIYSCFGQTIQYTDGSCNTSNVATCVAPASCQAGQSMCTNPPPSFTSFGLRTGHLEAHPQLVIRGASSKLFWNITNVVSCTVTGSNGDAWSTTASDASGASTGAINSLVYYTLRCTALTGISPASFTEVITVLPSPVYHEQ